MEVDTRWAFAPKSSLAVRSAPERDRNPSMPPRCALVSSSKSAGQRSRQIENGLEPLQLRRLNSRQRHAANIFLGFFVHIRFHRGSNVEGLLELRQLKTPGLPGQNAMEHLVELASKTKQILEQPFIGIQISHDILLD